MVTDDTTMSLALGEAILLSGGRVDALLAAAFDQWMRGKPVDIGNTVRRNLMRFRRTGEPCAPPSEHDAGNGAAMRLLPAALATFGLDADTVREAVLAQARVTHHSPIRRRLPDADRHVARPAGRRRQNRAATARCSR